MLWTDEWLSESEDWLVLGSLMLLPTGPRKNRAGPLLLCPSCIVLQPSHSTRPLVLPSLRSHKSAGSTPLGFSHKETRPCKWTRMGPTLCDRNQNFHTNTDRPCMYHDSDPQGATSQCRDGQALPSYRVRVSPVPQTLHTEKQAPSWSDKVHLVSHLR